MKFKQLLQNYHVPEWSEYYFEYESLKKNISVISEIKVSNERHKSSKTLGVSKEKQVEMKLTRSRTAVASHSAKRLTDAHDETSNKIVSLLKANLEKVQKFQSDTLSTLHNDFELLIQVKGHEDQDFEHSKFFDNFKHMSFDNHTVLDEKMIESTFCRLYEISNWLLNFSIINSISCNKIIRRIRVENKVMTSLTLFGHDLKVINETTTNQFTTHISCTRKLIDKVLFHYAHKYTEGSASKARKKLEGNVKKIQQEGIFTLMILVVLFLLILLTDFLLIFLPDDNQTNPITFSVFFPAFTFNIVILSLMLGLAGVVKLFRIYNVNFAVLFNLNFSFRINLIKILENIFWMFNLTGLLVLFYKLTVGYFYNAFLGLYYIPSILAIAFMLIYFMLPFKIFMHQIRWKTFVEIARNFFPFGKTGVQFKDFIFGDILTSLAKPFTDLTLAFCLLNCTECRIQSQRFECNRENYGGLVLLLIPFLIRIAQCLNRLYYTRLWWPHLANFFKYLTSISNYMTDVNVYITLNSVATAYLLFWDFHIDWNLFHLRSHNFLLRDKLTYPKMWYYLAIVFNTLIRLTWILSLYTFNIDAEMLFLILCLLEVYRRVQWVLFRVENEQLHNPESYRTHLLIPDLPAHFK